MLHINYQYSLCIILVGKLLVCEKISLMFDPSMECVLIQSPNASCSDHGLWQTIKINSNTYNVELYQSLIRQQTQCAIGVISVQDAMESQVTSLTRFTRRSFVMTNGAIEDKTPQSQLANDVLDILVTQRPNKDVKTLAIYRKCPIMSKRKKNNYETIISCTTSRCLKIADLFTSCPNPMKGQELLLVTPPGAPDVILPVFYGQLGGVLVRMFQMMAKKFGFEPHYWFGEMGQFVTQNRTFSQGGHKMVTIFFVLLSFI